MIYSIENVLSANVNDIMVLAHWRKSMNNDATEDEVVEQCIKLFDKPPPLPFGVDSDFYVATLKRYIEKGKPIPNSFNWYPDLPPGAMV